MRCRPMHHLLNVLCRGTNIERDAAEKESDVGKIGIAT